MVVHTLTFHTCLLSVPVLVPTTTHTGSVLRYIFTSPRFTHAGFTHYTDTAAAFSFYAYHVLPFWDSRCSGSVACFYHLTCRFTYHMNTTGVHIFTTFGFTAATQFTHTGFRSVWDLHTTPTTHWFTTPHTHLDLDGFRFWTLRSFPHHFVGRFFVFTFHHHHVHMDSMTDTAAVLHCVAPAGSVHLVGFYGSGSAVLPYTPHHTARSHLLHAPFSRTCTLCCLFCMRAARTCFHLPATLGSSFTPTVAPARTRCLHLHLFSHRIGWDSFTSFHGTCCTAPLFLCTFHTRSHMPLFTLHSCTSFPPSARLLHSLFTALCLLHVCTLHHLFLHCCTGSSLSFCFLIYWVCLLVLLQHAAPASGTSSASALHCLTTGSLSRTHSAI